MIHKTGKLFIDGKQYKYRYDKNEKYGVYMQVVLFYEIVKEIFFGKWKITISRYKEMRHSKDYMTLAFDPPGEAQNVAD